MGLFKNLFDSITGKTASKASKAQQAGFRAAQENTEEALGFIRPQIETGDKARDLFAAALGLDGPDAQRAFFNDFQNDPGFQAQQDAGIRAIGQSTSANLLRNSGGAAKELFNFGQQQMRGAFNDRLNRLAGLTSFGQAATGQFKGGTDALNQAVVGEGNARASGFINKGNAATSFVQDTLGTAANVAGRFAFGI